VSFLSISFCVLGIRDGSLAWSTAPSLFSDVVQRRIDQDLSILSIGIRLTLVNMRRFYALALVSRLPSVFVVAGWIVASTLCSQTSSNASASTKTYGTRNSHVDLDLALRGPTSRGLSENVPFVSLTTSPDPRTTLVPNPLSQYSNLALEVQLRNIS
jgi:hypothetical protein